MRSAPETTILGIPEPVPSLETHHQQVEGRPNGCRYVGRKEETRTKSNGMWRVNGKTPRYGRRKGKRRWTPTRAASQVTCMYVCRPMPGNSPIEDVMEHWTPTGCESKEYTYTVLRYVWKVMVCWTFIGPTTHQLSNPDTRPPVFKADWLWWYRKIREILW